MTTRQRIARLAVALGDVDGFLHMTGTGRYVPTPRATRESVGAVLYAAGVHPALHPLARLVYRAGIHTGYAFGYARGQARARAEGGAPPVTVYPVPMRDQKGTRREP